MPPAHPMLLPPPMPGTQIVDVDEAGSSTADPTTAWLASLADPSAAPVVSPAMSAIQLPTGPVPVVAPVVIPTAAAAAPAPVVTPTTAPAPVVQAAPLAAPAANGSPAVFLTGDGRQAAASTTSVVRGTDPAVLERYRAWVLDQATGAQTFVALDVDGPLEPWFLLSACGVATLLAWTHEDHGATYSVETWVDDIIPHQGISVGDRQLAIELLVAAALHAGGIHTEPTSRLLAYDPADLVTAMGALHVGLIRLYCGLEQISPARVLRDQFGLDSPALAAPPMQPAIAPR